MAADGARARHARPRERGARTELGHRAVGAADQSGRPGRHAGPVRRDAHPRRPGVGRPAHSVGRPRADAHVALRRLADGRAPGLPHRRRARASPHQLPRAAGRTADHRGGSGARAGSTRRPGRPALPRVAAAAAGWPRPLRAGAHAQHDDGLPRPGQHARTRPRGAPAVGLRLPAPTQHAALPGARPAYWWAGSAGRRRAPRPGPHSRQLLQPANGPTSLVSRAERVRGRARPARGRTSPGGQR